MSAPFKGVVNIDIKISTPDWITCSPCTGSPSVAHLFRRRSVLYA